MAAATRTVRWLAWPERGSGVVCLTVGKASSLYLVRELGERLELVNLASGEQYHVARLPDGSHRCDCPDAHYRNRADGCKHATAMSVAYAAWARRTAKPVEAT